MRGTVVTYNQSNRWGFIRAAGGLARNADIFFHANNVLTGDKSVKLFAAVEYDIGESNSNRPQAINVRVDGCAAEAPHVMSKPGKITGIKDDHHGYITLDDGSGAVHFLLSTVVYGVPAVGDAVDCEFKIEQGQRDAIRVRVL